VPRFSSIAGLVLLCLASFGLSNLSYAAEEPLSSQRQAELTHLLLHDCGSCHGMTLKGGLGPALTPDVLADKPSILLFQTIKFGRPGTPMPLWQGLLSDAEINWLVRTLKEGVSNE